MNGNSFVPEQYVSAGEILYNEPLKNHTSFRIGGPARALITPEGEEELVGVLKGLLSCGERFTVIGNGSNLLVPDEGYDGYVVRLADRNYIPEYFEENGKYRVYFPAGVRLSYIAKCLFEKELAGFEFAAGIPGTLGGAVLMDAGAYGGEMKDVILSVKVLTPEGAVITVPGDECDFSYRHSRFSDDGSFILGATLVLEKGEAAKIKEITDDLQKRRRDKQPLEYPSAGSTFKRPEGFFAGKLIEDAGLKGYRVGDACVSEKHSGFVINLGNATCADVLQLIADVRKRVLDLFGVELEPEVRILK